MPGGEGRLSVAALLMKLRAAIALGVLIVTFSILSPEFLTTGNLSILVKHVAINAILAIGVTFVILSGGIDLSVGSIAGLCGILAGALLSEGARPARRSASASTCMRGWWWRSLSPPAWRSAR